MREKGLFHGAPIRHMPKPRAPFRYKADSPTPGPYGTYLPGISSRARRVMAVMIFVFPSV